MTPIASEEVHESLYYHHESGVLVAEGVGQHIVVLTVVDMRPDEVKFDDIQVATRVSHLPRNKKNYVG